MQVINFENVSYAKERTIIHNASFSINKGDFVGIVGPNGSGKSTLVQLMLGIINPTAGTVLLWDEKPDRAIFHHVIGYIPQHIVQHEFQFPSTVDELVNSADALEKVGLSHTGKSLINTLSGGERQRVFIARALARKPELLVLDEPTTGIDVIEQSRFYSLIEKLNSEGMTIVLVSHEIEAMTKSVKHIMCINGGELCHVNAHDLASEHLIKHVYGHSVTGIHHHH